MSVNLYDGFTNKVTGESFKCISFSEKAFTFEWIVEPGGYVPFEHVHLKQDEIFYIKEGEMKLVINGQEFIVGQGERITVLKGKRHIAYNNRNSRLHCIIDYTPGLDTYNVFQCFGGLTIDRDTTKNGTVNIPKMLYFTGKMKAKALVRPTKIPAPLFYLAKQFFYIIGTIIGWRKYFKKYTGSVGV